MFAVASVVGLTLSLGLASSPASANTPPVDIRSSSCPSNIVEGQQSTCVVALQDLLWNWGYGQVLGSSGPNGQFGPDTLQAVEAFQRAAGLSVDGQAGPNTKAALYSSANPLVLAFQQEQERDGALCLDADTNTAGQDGQLIQGWQCNGTSEQEWERVAIPEHSGRFMMVNASDGLCLDADVNTAGSNAQKVQGWQCNGQTNQQWTWSGGTAIGGLESISDGKWLSTADIENNGQLITAQAGNNVNEQAWQTGH